MNAAALRRLLILLVWTRTCLFMANAADPALVQDHGFMYAHGFEDLDGHIWELAYMSGEPPAA